MENLIRRFRRFLAKIDPSHENPDAPIGWAPGHFYSPIPSLRAVFGRADRIFAVPEELPAIELRASSQLENLREISRFCEDHPFTEKQSDRARFYFDNPNFSYGEGLVYYGMMRWRRPARVVEIGSGFSTLVMLDACDRMRQHRPACTCIEPFPQLLLSLLRPGDQDTLEICHAELQDIPLGFFDQLQAGDFLFIDSTHVLKVGSDVNIILFEILPRLQSGVFVHFHDIMYPFEYPQQWIREGRGWNEAYAVRCFLQYNAAFNIELFNSWVGYFHRDLLLEVLPLAARNAGTSLWLQKTKAGENS